MSPWHLQGEMLINLPRSAPLWLLFVVALLSLLPRHGFEVWGQVEDGARPIICNHSTQCSVNSHLKQENVTFLISCIVCNQKKECSEKSPNNNNNRLLMAPHLIRAHSTYKDIRIHSFHHTGKCNIYHFFYCLQPEEKALSECTLGTGKCK